MWERGERKTCNAVEGVARLTCRLSFENEVAQSCPESSGCLGKWVGGVWVRKERAGWIEEARLEARAGRVGNRYRAELVAYCNDAEGWICGNKPRVCCVRRRKKQMSGRANDVCTIVEIPMDI